MRTRARLALALATGLSLLCTLLVPGSALATADSRTPAWERVQASMDATVQAGTPGMIANVRDEDGSWSSSAGVADVRTEHTPDADGRFRVGSVSKTFTATLVLQLAQEHRIGLDDPIQQYLPGLLPYREPITIRQLLQHTSGLPRDLPERDTWANLPEVDTERFVHFDPAEVVKSSTSQPLEFAPGTDWGYSNTGYIVLAMLVEKTTGKPIERVLAQRIQRPVGLADTSLVRDFPFLPGRAARGYEQLYEPPQGLTDVTTYNLSRYVGAGTVVSTGADLNRFYRALLGGTLLAPDMLAQMKTTVPATTPDGQYAGYDYGLGLFRFSLSRICSDGPAVWGHNGSVPGYTTWSMHTADGTKQISTMSSQSVTATEEQSSEALLTMASEFCRPDAASTAAKQWAASTAQAPLPAVHP